MLVRGVLVSPFGRLRLVNAFCRLFCCRCAAVVTASVSCHGRPAPGHEDLQKRVLDMERELQHLRNSQWPNGLMVLHDYNGPEGRLVHLRQGSLPAWDRQGRAYLSALPRANPGLMSPEGPFRHSLSIKFPGSPPHTYASQNLGPSGHWDADEETAKWSSRQAATLGLTQPSLVINVCSKIGLHSDKLYRRQATVVFALKNPRWVTIDQERGVQRFLVEEGDVTVLVGNLRHGVAQAGQLICAGCAGCADWVGCE